MPLTDNELDERLAAFRTPDPNLGAGVARELLLDAATAPRRPSPRLRRRWLTAGALAVAGALAIPTAAMAAYRVFAAQTGEIEHSGSTESFDGDEWIASSAPDFAEYVASIAPEHLPTPPGFDWNEAAAEISTMYATQMPGLSQRIALIRDFERTVWAAWVAEWVAADQASDAARRDAALAVMREVPSWPGVALTDEGDSYLMWDWVVRLSTEDPRANTLAGQALLQDTTHSQPIAIGQDGRNGGTYGTGAPSVRDPLDLWDGGDRSYIVDQVFQDFQSISTADDRSPGSAWQRDYRAALLDMAMRAGVADPEDAIDTQRIADDYYASLERSKSAADPEVVPTGSASSASPSIAPSDGATR